MLLILKISGSKLKHAFPIIGEVSHLIVDGDHYSGQSRSGRKPGPHQPSEGVHAQSVWLYLYY